MSRAVRMVPRPARTRSSTSTRASPTSRRRSAGRRRGATSRCSSAFFLFILLCNWSGLLPFVGRTEQLRAPDERRQRHDRARAGRVLSASTSRASARSAFGGYFGKFFTSAGSRRDRRGRHRPVRRRSSSSCSSSSSRSRWRCDSSATSTAARSRSASSPALTFAIIPVAMLGLEFLLNFMQALIFSRPDPHVHDHRDRGPPRGGARRRARRRRRAPRRKAPSRPTQPAR